MESLVRRPGHGIASILCRAVLVSFATATVAAVEVDAGVVLNELQVNTTGTDWEFVEIAGPAGASLAGLAVIGIESDAGASAGTVDFVLPLAGQIPVDGFWWAGSPTGQATYVASCGSADAGIADNALENSSATYLLVRGFAGAVGSDLDTDGDGVLDATPWLELLDAVAILDSATDFAYAGATALGPEGTFLPSGVERSPDFGSWSGSFLDFDTPNGTPGAGNAAGCDASASSIFIHDIQGSGGSVAITTLVSVEAVVTGDFQRADQLRGFFLQEEDADADASPATSEGIFVFCGSCAVDVAVGDKVRITGAPAEFFGMSQIGVTAAGGSVEVLTSGSELPTPTPVELPAEGSTRAEATFENVEGMLVTFADTLVVSEYFELARYGQLVLTAEARPRQFTDANMPGVAGYATFLTALNSRRIILDDDNNVQNDALGPTPADDEPYFWPRPGLSNTNLIRGGDSIANLTGILHWSFAGQSGTDAWRVRPVEEAFSYAFASSNARPEAPAEAGGSFRVASFNVLNYFTTINARGADSVAELDRQRQKTAAALCGLDADVVGLIEIQNDGGVSAADLLNGTNGVNAKCGPYAYVNTGVIGPDEIAVALIYRTASASPVGAPAVLTSLDDARFDETLNRPTLAQTFVDSASGGRLTVVVNHLKSKGSACPGDPDALDGQGNCSGTRTAAAAALVDWLATDPTGSGDPDFVILGDLNAYRNEDPIRIITVGSDGIGDTDDDYTDLLDYLVGAGAYTYLFDGQLGYLDHALASGPLLPQVTGVATWSINADEIPVFDYNDEIRDGTNEPTFERESTSLPIFETNAYRSSDHDPIVVGFTFDSDADGVPDGEDACAGTVIPEAVPSSSLRGKRWALTDDDLVFEAGIQVTSAFTTYDTRGCSCAQIIDRTGAGEGHRKFGCSNGLMLDWIGSLP
jgi:predicted extracellular nuclease